MPSNLPFELPHFSLDNVKDIGLKEFSEILGCDANVNVIIDLNGNANGVTLADTEAARKNNVILNVMLLYSIFKQFNNRLGSLNMTGGSHAYLDDQHSLHLGKNFACKESVNTVGGNGVNLLVNHHAYTLLAIAKTECSAKIYLVANVMLCDKLLKSLNNLTRTLDVTGTTDTNCDFHN
jgi:hypothetical protein